MSAPPYMKLFWGDYHRDTRHLTREEHGAYFLLLGEAWNRDGILPDDDALLARWALATAEEWAGLKPVVMALFKPYRGRWRHKRIAEELATYNDVSRKRKEAGKKGGSATRGKVIENTKAIAEQKPTKPESEPEPESQVVLFPEKPPTQQTDAGASSRGSRLPGNWEPDPALWSYAAQQGFADPEIRRMAEDFRDFWSAKPGKDGVKLDWAATWRRWVRTTLERRSPRHANQRRQDWI